MEEAPQPKKLFPSKFSVLGLFAVLTLILTIPLVVLLSQQQQEVRGRASSESSGKSPTQPPSRGTNAISGYVYLDQNKSGQRDREEKPFPNATIKITQENKGNSGPGNSNNQDLTVEVTTDSHGYFKYAFPNLLPDSTTFRVLLVLPAGYKTITTNPTILTNLHKDEKKTVEFGLIPLVSQTNTPPPAGGPTCTARPACLDATPRCLIAEPAGGWCPAITKTPTPTQSGPTPTGQFCAQVLTPARNNTTNACKVFPNSCIPAGWTVDQTCAVTPTP